jgi:hypothetical protein
MVKYVDIKILNKNKFEKIKVPLHDTTHTTPFSACIMRKNNILWL